MCQSCVCGGAHVPGIMDDLYLLFAPLLVVVFSVFYFGCQGSGSFSGHMVTLFVIHLLRSHKITSQMSPYQVFRNVLLHISKLSGGHSHFTSSLGGTVVCVPSRLNTNGCTDLGIKIASTHTSFPLALHSFLTLHLGDQSSVFLTLHLCNKSTIFLTSHLCNNSIVCRCDYSSAKSQDGTAQPPPLHLRRHC